MSAPAAPGAGDGAQKPKLLVIDDEPKLCQMLAGFFTHRGYEVRSVNRGEEALALASVYRPHVVLLDLLMPGMNGVDTLRELKRLAPPPKIVMLSAATLDDVAQGAIKLGADAFISKPLKLDDLEHLVSAFWPAMRR